MCISMIDDELLCPICGGNYLHHLKIDNYARGEDDVSCFHTTIDDKLTITRTDNNMDNPSMRRDGLTIEFYCESCDNKSIMRIAQHKGQTLIDWAGGGLCHTT